MFLETLEKSNPNLIKSAFELHQTGKILPDTYILDLDMILHNAKMILDEARKYGVKLYAMTKQIGRNPIVAKKLVELGFEGVVAVDYKEAKIMMDLNIKIGNIGHLVQIPSNMIEEVISVEPEIITVYSIEKIRQIDESAKKNKKIQKIMLRVLENDSHIYEGQQGGFHLNNFEQNILEIKKFNNILIKGLTSFPCFLYSESENKILPTQNIDTIKKAKNILEKNGISVEQINLPSATSVENIKMIYKNGGTHGEPGHSLTGTTPYNLYNIGKEVPAIIYVSEVSHNLQNKGYSYGGGHYRRSRIKKCLVGKKYENSKKIEITPPSDENIDYYFELSEECEVGDAVLSCFRTQIFVTRSDVAVVKGISKNKPEILGIYDSLGRKK